MECVLELSSSIQKIESESWNESYSINMIDSDRSKQHKMRQVSGLLKTITNIEGYRRIFYYPVMVGGRVKAIFEVGYQSESQVP